MIGCGCGLMGEQYRAQFAPKQEVAQGPVYQLVRQLCLLAMRGFDTHAVRFVCCVIAVCCACFVGCWYRTCAGALTSFVCCTQRERKVDKLGRAYGTGRRKTSIARVWIKEGSGQFTVNNKSIIQYFPEIQRQHLLEPLRTTDLAGKFDIVCTAEGGGITGQAGAIRLGIARALEAFQPELRPPLSRGKFFTPQFQ